MPPKSRLIFFTSSSDARAQVYRRCLPMGPLNDDPAGRHAGAEPRDGPRRVQSPGTARIGHGTAQREGLPRRERGIVQGASGQFDGEGSAGCRSGRRWRAAEGSGEKSKITPYSSVPEDPLTMQWCTLESAPSDPGRVLPRPSTPTMDDRGPAAGTSPAPSTGASC